MDEYTINIINLILCLETKKLRYFLPSFSQTIYNRKFTIVSNFSSFKMHVCTLALSKSGQTLCQLCEASISFLMKFKFSKGSFPICLLQWETRRLG